MKITPSSRILRMLGEIQFDEWQCVAELVDNAFDDFADIAREKTPWAGGYKVSVSLPSPKHDLSGSEVVITDTGRGMSYERLENAVRAGWSSNDRFDKLGLFGMGFNVSTARLGRLTRVLTTRAGDTEWFGVEIDLDRIGDDFEADDITEPKDDPSEHGTKIVIGRLHRARAEWLQRNPQALRNALASVYSWILANQPFELWVQGQRVMPRQACRWGDDRFVVHGSRTSPERFPAYIPIDETFEPADACLDCGNWQVPGKGRCDQCESTELRNRKRRIHGWLGIQRHLDRNEFGIDFIRNGRKILRFDKSLFDWKNPDDPLGLTVTEYPVELVHQGGRIIGEIHLDYVPVNYQKNAFETSDRGWKAAVDFLRGVGPLQPEKAKLAGYPDNTSYLGRLFKGYRRNDAGRKYLIPGDGKLPIHEETRRWAQKFWAGDPEYRTDQKWWDAIESHETRLAESKAGGVRPTTTGHPDESALLDALGLAPTGQSSPGAATETEPTEPTTDSAPVETQQERQTRLIAASIPMPELSRDFGTPRLGTLTLDARSVDDALVDANNQPTPVWLIQGPGNTAIALVNARHKVFTKMGVDPAELLLVEVASVLKVKAETSLGLAEIVAQLRTACLPDTALDKAVIGAQAREILSEIRRLMIVAIEDDPTRAFQFLTADERTSIENEMIADGQVSSASHLGTDGGFLRYAPPLFLVKLLESWPEAFLDGKVFIGSFSSLSSPSARRLSVAKVVGYMNDIATLLTFQSEPSPDQLRRTRLSTRLLAGEIVADS
ncbi:ATP-binding protein [Catenulispora subtropica]|uniref:ATP-binding region ATPase domain protein n=1 Tax=Catenulispora subtropica TaxID=450798 RepID=A0ABN2TFN1_9ACTN